MEPEGSTAIPNCIQTRLRDTPKYPDPKKGAANGFPKTYWIRRTEEGGMDCWVVLKELKGLVEYRRAV
jgi:hypothetical protein